MNLKSALGSSRANGWETAPQIRYFLHISRISPTNRKKAGQGDPRGLGGPSIFIVCVGVGAARPGGPCKYVQYMYSTSTYDMYVCMNDTYGVVEYITHMIQYLLLLLGSSLDCWLEGGRLKRFLMRPAQNKLSSSPLSYFPKIRWGVNFYCLTYLVMRQRKEKKKIQTKYPLLHPILEEEKKGRGRICPHIIRRCFIGVQPFEATNLMYNTHIPGTY